MIKRERERKVGEKDLVTIKRIGQLLLVYAISRFFRKPRKSEFCRLSNDYDQLFEIVM